MATNSWLGGAPKRAGVLYVIPSAVTIGSQFSLTIGNASLTYTAAAATVADVTAGLAALVLASVLPQFAATEVVATDGSTYLRLTCGTPGVPISVSASAAVGTGTGTPAISIAASLGTPVNGTFTPTHAAGSLIHSTTYYYRISAINEVGETVASTESNGTTLTGADDQQMSVTWSRVPGATGYRVYGRSTGAELYIGGTVGESSTTYVDTGAISPSGALPVSGSSAYSSQGPNDATTTSNWSAAHTPTSTDALVLNQSNIPILYGLDNGGGGFTVATIERTASMAAQIGLPDTNPGSNGVAYPEYRPVKFKIGVASNGNAVNLGNGIGSHPPMERWDFNGTQPTVTIYGTAPQSQLAFGGQSLETCTISNTAGAATLAILQGSVGVCVDVGSTGTLATIQIGYTNQPLTDSVVRLGSGTTVTTINKTAGQLTTNGAVTTLNQTDRGGVTWDLAGAITTATIDNGTFYLVGGGTVSTANIGANGTVDCTKSLVAKTISACNGYAGGALIDSGKTLQASFPLTLVRCHLGGKGDRSTFYYDPGLSGSGNTVLTRT